MAHLLASARSKIKICYRTHTATQEDWSLLSDLTGYRRPWSYSESRLPQRAHLIGQLYDMVNAGELKDFGIMRAVQGTYVAIIMQFHGFVEELKSFLYHRVAESGMPIAKIPDMLPLRPVYDPDYVDLQSRLAIMKALRIKLNSLRRKSRSALARLREASQASSQPWKLG